MSPILFVILVVVAIAVIAYGLYRAGFSVDKLKVRLGIVEAEASREKPSKDTESPPPVRTEVRQRAQEGGAISGSGITAPAQAGAKIDQQAKGEKSKIDDSPIELD